jgi:hypothetical protein
LEDVSKRAKERFIDPANLMQTSKQGEHVPYSELGLLSSLYDPKYDSESSKKPKSKRFSALQGLEINIQSSVIDILCDMQNEAIIET